MTWSSLTPVVPVLIVRLQDANKIGHAGSIPVFGHNRVSDAGWLLCQTRTRRSAIFFMAYSLQTTVAVKTNYWRGGPPLDQEKVGGRYAADLVLQLPAREGRFRCFALRIHR
jgi:hypothetical protein